MDRRLGRLVERADALAERADRLVASALRSVRGEMALLAEELNLGGSARDRERAEGEIRRRLAKLSKRLDALLSRQNELAAKAAASDASEMKGVEVEYSKSRAEAVCRLVSPAQGDSLAAVLTDRMAQSLVNALRSATVAALRQNAVEGGTLRDMGRDILSRWNAAASERPVFTDSSGRAWDTGRYVQMNARTNAMRVYNDCLADALARTGDDLARVSRGGDPTCDGCFPWEGVILSLTGKTKGFPTYEQARASGCFHPNCTHTLDPVDEAVDADEIALQRGHPLGEPGESGGWSFDEADERRWEMDVDRKMLADPSLTREAAETAVNRDNLEANVRNGLVRADAGEIVAKLTDAQVSALCPGGNPPRFEPVKRVRGGTRKEPKFEEERWRRGSRGGVVHVRRDATAERIAEVCGVKDAEGEEDAKPEKPKDPLAHDPIPEFKTADAGMKYVSDTLGVHCAGFGDFDPAFVRGIAEAVADAKAHIGESDRLRGVWTCSEYHREMLEARKQQYLAIRDLSNADDAFRKKVEKSCEDAAEKDLRRWGVPETMSAYGKAWRGWQSQSLPQFNGIVLNDRLDRMDRTGEVKSGFKAKGCEKPISTVYHELGHIIDYQLNLNRIGGNGKPQNKTLKKIWADPEAVRTGLSRYGAKNSRETVAEAWAEYRMNPNPREIALAIGREIDILSLQRLGKES